MPAYRVSLCHSVCTSIVRFAAAVSHRGVVFSACGGKSSSRPPRSGQRRAVPPVQHNTMGSRSINACVSSVPKSMIFLLPFMCDIRPDCNGAWQSGAERSCARARTDFPRQADRRGAVHSRNIPILWHGEGVLRIEVVGLAFFHVVATRQHGCWTLPGPVRRDRVWRHSPETVCTCATFRILVTMSSNGLIYGGWVFKCMLSQIRRAGKWACCTQPAWLPACSRLCGGGSWSESMHATRTVSR